MKIMLRLFLVFCLFGSVFVHAKEVVAPTQFIAFGDAPYGEQGEKKFPALIEKINQTGVEFSVHIGDIKNGRTVCSDEHFKKIYNWFATFKTAIVYTPGDNEWTDCHRKNNGSYEPDERLRKLRQVFFRNPSRSLGMKPMILESQGQSQKHQAYVENAMWQKDDIIFVTIHMVGSYNNVDRNAKTTAEYVKRNAANIAWLQNAFAKAQKQNAKAVIVLTQANPWMLTSTGDFGVVGGFSEFMNALNKQTTDFKKPVLFVHGDTHTYRYDKKSVSPDFQKLKNFYRLEVFGDGDTVAVLVTMDLTESEPFVFKKIAP